MGIRLQSRFSQGLLQEFCHFQSYTKELSLLFLLKSDGTECILVMNPNVKFCKLTAANLSSNVDGNIFGKSLSATGNRNSMNGTIMNTANGMRRSKSCVVRRSWEHPQCLRLLELNTTYLSLFTPSQSFSLQDLPLKSRRYPDLRH